MIYNAHITIRFVDESWDDEGVDEGSNSTVSAVWKESIPLEYVPKPQPGSADTKVTSVVQSTPCIIYKNLATPGLQTVTTQVNAVVGARETSGVC